MYLLTKMQSIFCFSFLSLSFFSRVVAVLLDLFVNLDCCFINNAHVFLYAVVFVLKARNVISLYEIIKSAWLDLT